MNNFLFENKTKVYFGKGGVKEYLGCLLEHYGDTVMLAYGGGSIKHNGIYDEIVGILNAEGKRIVEFPGIMPNPTYAKVQEGAKLARENHVDLILAVGGGSVSDCCKVVSAQAKVDEDLWELENTKHTRPTEFIPLGTIVMVFGTGSEMNNGAVITHEEKKIKGALWGAQADFAFLDPTYTLSVPMKQVISGAFDTLSHAMETYFGKPDENNLSDDINEAVMRSVIRNIRVLLTDKDNYEARSELAWASAMAENGILKIGKVTDFQCHMIEHQLGAYTNCNHGAGLAVIHPVLYPSPAPGQHRTVRPLCTERLGHRPGGQIRAETGTGWRGGSGGLHQGDRDAHHLCRTEHPCRHRPQGCGRFHRADRRLLQEAEPRRTAGHSQRVQVIYRPLREMAHMGVQRRPNHERQVHYPCPTQEQPPQCVRHLCH